MSEEQVIQPEESNDRSLEKKYCTFDDFMKIELRVAEVIAAEDHPNADKLLKIRVRVGDKEKQICAGMKAWYRPEEMIGKRLIIVNNLEPRKLRGEISEGMLLAAEDEISGRFTLVTVDKPDFPCGGKVS